MADEKPAAENKPAPAENKTAAAAANAVNQAIAAAPVDSAATDDDKLWGMLAHILAIFTWFIGPLVVYLVKKDQSKFVAFHSLQALVFSLALTVVYVVLMIPMFILMTIMPFIIFLIAPLFSLVGLAFLVYVIYVAIKAKDGQLMKYIVIGDIIYKKVYGG